MCKILQKIKIPSKHFVRRALGGIVFILLFFVSSIIPSVVHASPFSDGWLYNKVVTITGQSGAGINYQLKLNVGESSGSSGADFHLEENSIDFPSTKNDGGDLRFTDNDGETLLDFWVESVSGTTPNRTATIWVEVADDLGSDTDIYVYYNKSGASSLSNGKNTFIIFDDFDGASLDGGLWTQRNGAAVSFSDSIMTTTANSNDPSRINATGGPTADNNAIRAKFRVTGGTQDDERIGVGCRSEDDASPTAYNYIVHDFTNLDEIKFLHDGLEWGTVGETSWAKNSWYTFEIFHDGSNVRARRDDSTWKTWIPSNALGAGYLSLNIGSSDAVSEWEWAMVRKAVATEPSFSSASSEDSLPIVSTLSPVDDASSVATTSNLVITFSEAVDAKSGNITLYKLGGTEIEVFDVTSDISGSGTNTITINPTADLIEQTAYYVQIGANAFDDTSGNSYAGVSDTTSWSFTTATTPTQAPTPSSTPSSSTTKASSPTCSSFPPGGAPNLFQIDAFEDSATIFFTPILGTSEYYISYSDQNSDAEQHGVSVNLGSLGVQSFTINTLISGKEYYFKVRGQNGCMPGDWSNIRSAMTNSSVVVESIKYEEEEILNDQEEKVKAEETREPAKSEEEQVSYKVTILVQEQKKPKPNAKVIIPELDKEVVTDEQGKAVIENVPRGKYNFKLVDQAFAAEDTIDVRGDDQGFDVVINIKVDKPLFTTPAWLGIIAIAVLGSWLLVKIKFKIKKRH